jgi:glutathione S-transferase
MELWTSATPNGWKVSIMIEELIEAGIDMSHVKVRHINLAKGEQFSKEFSERNPNQKIPVLNATAVYRSFTFFTVFSSHPKDGCLLDVHKT